MIVKRAALRPVPSFLLPFSQISPATSLQTRWLHHRIPQPPVPSPTPFVPDPQTFLTLIGRNLSQHASKIPSWEALFSLSSAQLKELGIEPPRSRRYLLRWRDKFRKGQYGIGGDLQHVEDGVAQLRVVEVPSQQGPGTATATASAGNRKVVINIPVAGGSAAAAPGEAIVPVKGVQVKGAHTIVGPHVQPVKGGRGAQLVIKEGLWEDVRGRKIDGGERRRAEVRSKRRAEERRAAR
ncbi:IGR protein motif-domain-containing protein [Xylogone sp. PMI_703]|nr:IGR protein motif-domain-containing protein [Xylogone sp. PMI_703]